MDTFNGREAIEEAFKDPEGHKRPDVQQLVKEVVLPLIDEGKVRAAMPVAPGQWKVNPWVKQAILLAFRMWSVETHAVDGRSTYMGSMYTWYDKVPLSRKLGGHRKVYGGICRYPCFVYPSLSTVQMPSLINVGAYVDEGTMVDTWATVGSCAQIGHNVHLAGGVGIGGVLEPPQAQPVIIEDNAFVGSRCIVVEGAIVEEGAILAANCVITATSQIIDARPGPNQGKVYRGRIPARAVVVPGTRPRNFASDIHPSEPAISAAFATGFTAHLACCYIVGTRNESNEPKVSLEQALREYEVAA